MVLPFTLRCLSICRTGYERTLLRRTYSWCRRTADEERLEGSTTQRVSTFQQCHGISSTPILRSDTEQTWSGRGGSRSGNWWQWCTSSSTSCFPSRLHHLPAWILSELWRGYEGSLVTLFVAGLVVQWTLLIQMLHSLLATFSWWWQCVGESSLLREYTLWSS